MGTRRQARELAMQALFSMDMSNAFSSKMFEDYCGCFPPGKRFYPFFEFLVKGVLENKALIDQVIEHYSSNWKMRRMACVDRNILRIGVFEILFSADIPVKVSINEAIDIGKRFGTPESGAFINGILDSVRLAIEAGTLQKPPASYIRPAPQDSDDD
jgi:transcription antitermination protein NusB